MKKIKHYRSSFPKYFFKNLDFRDTIRTCRVKHNICAHFTHGCSNCLSSKECAELTTLIIRYGGDFNRKRN